LENELAVLACMMQGGEKTIAEVSHSLESGDFEDETNGFLFYRIVDRWTRREGIDRVTLRDDLKVVDVAAGNLVDALYAKSVVLENVGDYAEAVYRDSMMRQIAKAAQMQGQFSHESVDYKGVLAASQALLDTVAEREFTRENGAIGPIVDSLDSDIADRAASGRPPGFLSGIPQYDSLYGGLRRGHIHYVSAYTSVGKSWWAVRSALGWNDDGAKVAIFSLEMTAQQWATRLIACKTGLNSLVIESGLMDANQRMQYEDAAEYLRSSNILIFSSDRRINTIMGKVRQHQPDIVVIDYIQKVQGEKGASEYETITRASLDISAMAARNRCGVLAVSSVSNETMFGRNKESNEPRMKGSGSLAYDADGVIELRRDKQASPTLLEVRYLKNRHGPTGFGNYRFDVSCGAMEELSAG